ncbi:MAG: hypothetical protein H6Q89_858 [Myxococcaceae bacterium]|nr:hypothetical protein [Myxococcaceae bacterium]
MASELFELSMLGGAVERRYRRLRPEVDRLPWGTLDVTKYSAAVLNVARTTWTEAAFQEHRTAAACAATLKALIAARAPLDLIAMATRFPLDEMVHVEMCARLAMELGGGAPLEHDPLDLIREPDPKLPALLQAAELVVRNFCVGEALSIPMLRGSWHAAGHPLIKAVLGRIVKDEAAHGQFGWFFLEWAGELLTDADRTHLAQQAGLTINAVTERWKQIKPLEDSQDPERLGWMESASYVALARRSMQTSVIAPLKRHGIDVAAWLAS